MLEMNAAQIGPETNSNPRSHGDLRRQMRYNLPLWKIPNFVSFCTRDQKLKTGYTGFSPFLKEEEEGDLALQQLES